MSTSGWSAAGQNMPAFLPCCFLGEIRLPLCAGELLHKHRLTFYNWICTHLNIFEVKMHTQVCQTFLQGALTHIFHQLQFLLCWSPSLTWCSSPICKLQGVTTSYTFITPSVNQTRTIDQNFLCYQMVERSRLVIWEVEFVCDPPKLEGNLCFYRFLDEQKHI